MSVPFNASIPADLIRNMAGPTPSGMGFVNLPGVENAMRILGIPNVGDPITSVQRFQASTQASAPTGGFQAGEGSFVSLDRRPFALTCQKWLENTDKNAIRYLYSKTNPRSVQWTHNLRVSDQKTLAGTVQHAWRQNLGVRRRTFFSEPVITITFQSGNLMPIYPARLRDPRNRAQQTEMPRGLDNFYRFAELLNESRILTGDGNRQANIVYLLYTSHVYPSMVLAGAFTPDGFSWTDNAEDPNKIEWTSSFTVYDSYPQFYDANALITAWKTSQGFATNKEDNVGDHPIPAQSIIPGRTPNLGPNQNDTGTNTNTTFA